MDENTRQNRKFKFTKKMIDTLHRIHKMQKQESRNIQMHRSLVYVSLSARTEESFFTCVTVSIKENVWFQSESFLLFLFRKQGRGLMTSRT